MNSRPSLSSLFRAYHLAKKCGKFDTARINRALGLAQARRVEWDGETLITHTTRKQKGQEVQVTHHTTKFGCDCEDKVYGKGHTCKHELARYLLLRAAILDAEKDAARQVA